jgi:hypothetical protein
MRVGPLLLILAACAGPPIFSAGYGKKSDRIVTCITARHKPPPARLPE